MISSEIIQTDGVPMGETVMGETIVGETIMGDSMMGDCCHGPLGTWYVQAGAVIMPAIPAFYHHPKTIDDLVTQYVCRVLAQIDLLQERMFRWTGKGESKKAEA